eukprot:Sdes_comp18595_c0_seq1m8741
MKKILIHSDSQYVIKAATSWIPGWRKAPTKTCFDNFNQKITNGDLFDQLDRLRNEFESVRFEYCEAHMGIYGNEKADELAKKGAEKSVLNENDDEEETCD